jgi:hypothetical protein
MVHIKITNGFASDADICNARHAATKVLQEYGVTAEDAYATFCDQGSTKTGHAAVWKDAQDAASVALTADWRAGLRALRTSCMICICP